MAKSKKAVEKTPKKHSPKYSKIAATCSKELTAKKKALANAEKALAKAQKTHSELLSEVARLDMLDRSLKALINGTEPPQNVRYVYSYPQWVWYPYNGGWYWNNGSYTMTLGNTGLQNFQGGIFTNAQSGNLSINTTPSVAANTVTVSNASFPSSSLTTSGSGSFMNCSDSSLIGYNSSGISNVSLTSSAPSAYSFTTTAGTLGAVDSSVETVDLSTGAVDPEVIQEPVEAVAAVEEK